MRATGGPAPLRVVLVALALSAALAGCGSSGLRSTVADTEGQWGVSAWLAGGDSIQVGTSHFCVAGDQPARISEVTWEDVDGVEFVDHVVVTQPVEESTVGTAAGPLGTDLPGRQGLTISSPCTDFDDGVPAAGVEISYVVLEVRLAEGREVGRARGVRVDSDRGRAVDPMAVMLCDEELVPDCSAEDIFPDP